MKLPLLLSVPHAGLRVPPEAADRCGLSAAQILEESDDGAAEIYLPLEPDVAALATTDIARVIVDLNRAEDDFTKDGVIKTHSSWDAPVYRRPPTGEAIQAMLDLYYRPYHRRLREWAHRARAGVDCHTMAAVGPPSGPGPGLARPPLCLSDGGGACPSDWFAAFARCLEEEFALPVAINAPFRGGYITRSHARELPWLQLEFSRADFLPLSEKRDRLRRALAKWCETTLSK